MHGVRPHKMHTVLIFILQQTRLNKKALFLQDDMYNNEKGRTHFAPYNYKAFYTLYPSYQN